MSGGDEHVYVTVPNDTPDNSNFERTSFDRSGNVDNEPLRTSNAYTVIPV